MIQDLPIGIGGTVETEFVGGRVASATFTLIASDGTVLTASAAATLDPVNTTLAVATVAGDSSATLTSVVGIATDGRRYLVGGEEVTVRSVVGPVVTFWESLEFDHAIATAFQGVRVTYDVSAGGAAAEQWDCQGVFTPLTGAPQVEVVNVTRYPIPVNLIGMTDVRDFLPKALQSVALELNFPRSFRQARNNALLLIGSKDRASRFLGVDHFRPLAARQWCVDRRFEYGSAWTDVIDRVEADRDKWLALVLGQTPRSEADGTATPGPGGSVLPDINLGAL